MSDNPYLKRTQKHPIGAAGRASENKVASRMGARLTPSSGALAGAKGDMTTPRFLIEAKSTLKDSMTLKLDWLCKIGAEARSKGKTPALTITFVRPNGEPVMNGRWVMIPENLFEAFSNEQV